MGKGEYDYRVEYDTHNKVFDTWTGVLKFLARVKVTKIDLAIKGIRIYKVRRNP